MLCVCLKCFQKAPDKWCDIWKAGHHVFWIVSRKVCRMSQTGSVCEVWDSLSDRRDLLLIQQEATCFSLSFLREEWKQYGSRNTNSRQTPDDRRFDAARAAARSWLGTCEQLHDLFRYLAECPSTLLADQEGFMGLGTKEVPFYQIGSRLFGLMKIYL